MGVRAAAIGPCIPSAGDVLREVVIGHLNLIVLVRLARLLSVTVGPNPPAEVIHESSGFTIQ